MYNKEKFPIGTTVNDKNESIVYSWDEDKMIYYGPNPNFNEWKPLHVKARNEKEAYNIVRCYFDQHELFMRLYA